MDTEGVAGKERHSGAGSSLRHMIDADVHVYPRSAEELRQYVAEPWRSRNWGQMTGRGAYNAPGGNRLDSVPPGGGPAGSDPDFLWQQVFARDRLHVHYAVLIEILGGVHHDPALNAAYRAAINEWMAGTWLGAYNGHGRFKGSISVPANDPAAAAREIEKWAGHPHFVQVLLPPWGITEPYGHPQYDPIWRAASRHGLPVAIHVNAGERRPWVTPVGFPRYWSEFHAVMYPLTYAAHLTSLACDGVFDRFENLRFVFVEGGFHWAASILERLVATAPYLHRELSPRPAPTLQRLEEHVRFTSMPVEDAPLAAQLVKSLELSDAGRLLMLASDYPHWDADDPLRALPRLPAELERRIFYENASELYGLPVTLA